jgi:uncharacterized protein YjbJ (UPF0337 family)
VDQLAEAGAANSPRAVCAQELQPCHSRSLFASRERSHSTDWNRVEGNWKQAKGKVKEKWGKLTDDDRNVINGQRDQLEGKIQERYGIAKIRCARTLMIGTALKSGERRSPKRALAGPAGLFFALVGISGHGDFMGLVRGSRSAGGVVLHQGYRRCECFRTPLAGGRSIQLPSMRTSRSL